MVNVRQCGGKVVVMKYFLKMWRNTVDDSIEQTLKILSKLLSSLVVIYLNDCPSILVIP